MQSSAGALHGNASGGAALFLSSQVGSAMQESGSPRRGPERTNIVVGVRVRPLSDMEVARGDPDVWRCDGPTLRERSQRGDREGRRRHTFDQVFAPGTRTSRVYDSVGVPIIRSAMEGFNATVFAYGQTGSGKTHTLLGTETEPGVTILAAHDVFQWAQERPQLDFLIRVSYLEIYNEEIRDLLNPLARERNGALRIVDNPVAGPYVRGLTEEVVLTPTRILEILRIGEGHRAVASTSMNARSSRSHTLFRMVIESRA